MKKVISTEGAPNAIGPYSQAIKGGDLVFCSGQIGMDPRTGELVSDSVEDQARRALQNLRAVLEAAGTGFENVVKTTVFLTSMDNFGTMNEVYGEFFGDAPPARSTIAVRELPKGALVEIEAIAHI